MMFAACTRYVRQSLASAAICSWCMAVWIQEVCLTRHLILKQTMSLIAGDCRFKGQLISDFRPSTKAFCTLTSA
ncbi:hypothetical protein D3C76_941300 [compost metagenome]